jgi:hypothetical protein
VHEKMTLRDDLIAAKALIDTPEKWCKGSYHNSGAHDAHCVIGAARAIAPYYAGNRQQLLLEAIAGSLPPRRRAKYLWQWNDAPSRSHSEVMALFDRAIAAAEASAS